MIGIDILFKDTKKQPPSGYMNVPQGGCFIKSLKINKATELNV